MKSMFKFVFFFYVFVAWMLPVPELDTVAITNLRKPLIWINSQNWHKYVKNTQTQMQIERQNPVPY